MFGTEEIDGKLVISMELMPGGTLADGVARRGALPYPEAVDAVLQIVAGLRAAEAQGVLHRDIKPANCFVDADDTVKVGDYGLSKPTGDSERTALTQTGAVMGTPSFAPPEQLKGEKVDVRSDIYAVGATLSYLLTGASPFRGSNPVQVISAVLSEQPSSLPELTRAAPPGLRKLILRCLEKDPARRPQTYDELERGLEPFGSKTPQPAAVGLRLLAGAVDSVAAFVATVIMGLLIAPLEPRAAWLEHDVTEIVALSLGFVLYFAVFESVLSATPGKFMFGLRVVPHELGHASVASMLARAALFGLPFAITVSVVAVLEPEAVWLPLLTVLLSPLVMFVGAHRDSLRRGFHDRWSGSFVSTRRSAVKPRAMPIAAAGVCPVEAERTVAAYRIVGQLEAFPGAPTVVARDEVLEREVWLRERPAGTEMSPRRRIVARPTRLRWLAGSAADRRRSRRPATSRGARCARAARER